MQNDDEWFEFDPYDHIMELTNLVNELARNHNELVNDYHKTQKRIKRLELQMHEIRQLLLQS